MPLRWSNRLSRRSARACKNRCDGRPACGKGLSIADDSWFFLVYRARVSPWGDSGVSATTFKVGTGLYFIVMAMISSAIGGYLAGRLRTKWVGVQTSVPLGEHELVVRAWNAAGQTQPANPKEVWNFKGYLCTAWHRAKVKVQFGDEGKRR